MTKKYEKNRLGGGRGFGGSQPQVVRDDDRIPPSEFEVVLYDKDRAVKLLVRTGEELHPGELVSLFADAGVEAGLDEETLQGTAKSLDDGFLLSWVPPGQNELDLQRKLGESWEPVLGEAA